MSLPPWPRPLELLEYHARVVEALVALGRQRATVSQDPKSQFFGKSLPDFEEALRQTREELDAQVVMAQIAACEGTLRTDFSVRIRAKTKDAIRKQFRDLEKKHGRWVRIDDIIELWKTNGASSHAVGQFKRLLIRRHWLAHGRYWRDKSGVTPDPAEAQFIIESFFAALSALVADFPRT